MAVFVTPCSVAPVALPGPHGDACVPNVGPLADAAVVEVDPDDDPPLGDEVDDDDAPPVDDEPRPLLHATAASARTQSTPNAWNLRRL